MDSHGLVVADIPFRQRSVIQHGDLLRDFPGLADAGTAVVGLLMPSQPAMRPEGPRAIRSFTAQHLQSAVETHEVIDHHGVAESAQRADRLLGEVFHVTQQMMAVRVILVEEGLVTETASIKLRRLAWS